MRIGLYDYDLDPYGYNSISIDLMKIAADYFIKKDIYSLMSSLNRLDYYSKIHYWADLKPHYLSRELLRDNIEPGGKVFGIKIPRELEDLKSDTGIYRKWYEKYGDNRRTSKDIITATLNASHIRLMRDNDYLDYSKHLNLSRKTIIIHDDNIFQIKNWEEIFKDIGLIKSFNCFGFRKPLVISSLEENEAIRKFQLSYNFSKFRFNLDSSVEDLEFFAKQCEKSWNKQQLFVVPNKSFTTNEEIKLFLRKILLKYIFCQSLAPGFFLTYDKVFYFKENENNISSFIDLLEFWSIKRKIRSNYFQNISFMEFLSLIPDNNKMAALGYLKQDAILKEIALLHPRQITKEMVSKYESIRD